MTKKKNKSLKFRLHKEVRDEFVGSREDLSCSFAQMDMLIALRRSTFILLLLAVLAACIWNSEG